MKKFLLNLFIFCSTFSIIGCGFHLRGTADVPIWLNNVNITVEHAHRDLANILAEELRSYHVKLCPNPALANYMVIIEHDEFKEHITSISSGSLSRQYNLSYQVFFKLVKANGEELIPLTSVKVNRNMTVNTNRMLGSNQEESLLKAEMRRAAVTKLLYRISRSHI